jgi:hypothetical protein
MWRIVHFILFHFFARLAGRTRRAFRWQGLLDADALAFKFFPVRNMYLYRWVGMMAG